MHIAHLAFHFDFIYFYVLTDDINFNFTSFNYSDISASESQHIKVYFPLHAHAPQPPSSISHIEYCDFSLHILVARAYDYCCCCHYFAAIFRFGIFIVSFENWEAKKSARTFIKQSMLENDVTF